MRCSYLLTYLYLLVFKFKFTLNTGTGVQDNQKQLQTTPKAYFLRHYVAANAFASMHHL